MVAAELDKTLVERVSDEILIMGAGFESRVEEGLNLKDGAHAPELEVAEEELTMREPRIAAGSVQQIGGGLSHWTNSTSLRWKGRRCRLERRRQCLRLVCTA